MLKKSHKNLVCTLYRITFVLNQTRHASRKISAPGRVFDFYGSAIQERRAK